MDDRAGGEAGIVAEDYCLYRQISLILDHGSATFSLYDWEREFHGFGEHFLLLRHYMIIWAHVIYFLPQSEDLSSL